MCQSDALGGFFHVVFRKNDKNLTIVQKNGLTSCYLLKQYNNFEQFKTTQFVSPELSSPPEQSWHFDFRFKIFRVAWEHYKYSTNLFFVLISMTSLLLPLQHCLFVLLIQLSIIFGQGSTFPEARCITLSVKARVKAHIIFTKTFALPFSLYRLLAQCNQTGLGILPRRNLGVVDSFLEVRRSQPSIYSIFL